jgi:uncharacterized RDD family membrane protein YckC
MSNIDNVEYAGFWIRVGASFIDGILFAIFTLPLTMIVYGDALWESESFLLGPADFLINYVLPAVIVVLFWLYKSATPGKMVFKLRIVDATTGNMLTVGQAMGRYLAYFLASIPLLLGIIWIGFDKKKQGWHDKLANTVVIRDKSQE